ncbi:hypothetical protein HK102_001821, partial [Quaeritorhiza haematococci]
GGGKGFASVGKKGEQSEAIDVDVEVIEVKEEKATAAENIGNDTKDSLTAKQGRENKIRANFSLWRYNRSKRKFEHAITGDVRDMAPAKTSRGGILADDMGLGKTIEIIGLILSTKEGTSGEVGERSGGSSAREVTDAGQLGGGAGGMAVSGLNGTNNTGSAEANKQDASLGSGQSLPGPNSISTRITLPFAFAPIGPSTSINLHQQTAATISQPQQQPQQQVVPTSGGPIPSNATLIVCPLSTVSNWEEQISSHDVVLTTYTIASLEYNRVFKQKDKGTVSSSGVGGNNGSGSSSFDLADPVEAGDGSGSGGDAPNSVLHMIKWFRVVLVSLAERIQLACC